MLFRPSRKGCSWITTYQSPITIAQSITFSSVLRARKHSQISEGYLGSIKPKGFIEQSQFVFPLFIIITPFSCYFLLFPLSIPSSICLLVFLGLKSEPEALRTNSGHRQCNIQKGKFIYYSNRIILSIEFLAPSCLTISSLMLLFKPKMISSRAILQIKLSSFRTQLECWNTGILENWALGKWISVTMVKYILTKKLKIHFNKKFTLKTNIPLFQA